VDTLHRGKMEGAKQVTTFDTQYLEKNRAAWYIGRNKRHRELKKFLQYKITHSNEAFFLETLRAMAKK